MKLRITMTIVTLSLVLGLALWSAVRGVQAQASATYPLNPSSFTSLGASPFTTDGTYSIDASKNNAAPTLSGPGIAVPIAGVFFSPSGGTVTNDEIAVFTFNSLNIPAGVLIGHAANSNSRPVALLSLSTATIDGSIIVSGSNGVGNDGGNAGPGGGGGGGGTFDGIGGLGFAGGEGGGPFIGGAGGSVVAGGGGTSQPGSLHQGGGGAFGGNGGNASVPGIGGTAYGNLALILQGGSGGAGSGVGTTGTRGGGGGSGAIELGAIGNLTLSGTVLANGGPSSGGAIARAGGGAGGGILVHAPTVALTGSLNAIGGATQFGGGGGGGRVLILTADGTLANGSLDANVNVSGGAGFGGGGAGVKQLGIGMFNQAPVAQCQSVTVAADASCTANASIDNGSYDPDSGDTITVTQSPAGPYPLGTTTVELTVTDSQGASSSCQATVTVVDQTAPVVSCPANVVVYLPLNSMDTGMVVNYSTPTATDNCSASPTITTSKASGSIFPVGTTTVNVTATDATGNQTSCSFTVTVRYNFSGFFQPVDNLPTINSVNAGQSIPVKFSLSGNKGLNIFAAGYPQSAQVACGGGGADDIEETVTAGGSSLSYDATTDQYKYVWKTEKAWKGTCRKLVLKFNDGTTREALFQFK
jgi:hypothetical protein